MYTPEQNTNKERRHVVCKDGVNHQRIERKHVIKIVRKAPGFRINDGQGQLIVFSELLYWKECRESYATLVQLLWEPPTLQQEKAWWFPKILTLCNTQGAYTDEKQGHNHVWVTIILTDLNQTEAHFCWHTKKSHLH